MFPFGEAELRHLLSVYGYWAVMAFVGIESIGIPLPGETMLVAAAIYAGASHQLSIELVIAAAIAGAVMGDNIGYAIGYFGGRPFVERMGRFFRIGPSHFARSELFFARYGGVTVLFARFVLGLRTWASVMAGMSRMPFWTFQLFSAIGGVAWAILIGTIGFTLGSNWALVERLIRYLGIGGLVLVAAVIVGVLLLRMRAAHS